MRYIGIIPRITLFQGRVLNSHFGTDSCAEVARILYEEGADSLLLYNVDYNSSGVAGMSAIVNETVNRVFIPVQVCGTIYETAQIRILISEGVDRVYYNTSALRSAWRIDDAVDRLGQHYIGLALDCRRIEGIGNREVLTDCASNASGKDAYLWAVEASKRGACELLLTAQPPKGSSQASDWDAVRQLVDALRIPVTVSGGFSKAQDFATAISSGASNVTSTALGNGSVRIQDIKKELRAQNILVR